MQWMSCMKRPETCLYRLVQAQAQPSLSSAYMLLLRTRVHVRTLQDIVIDQTYKVSGLIAASPASCFFVEILTRSGQEK